MVLDSIELGSLLLRDANISNQLYHLRTTFSQATTMQFIVEGVFKPRWRRK